MDKLIIGSYDEFEKYVGQELGVSDYLNINQERINLFAEATLDHQWIHTNPERAKKESPFQNIIAHGYLTLSLLPYLWGQIIEIRNVKMIVNYGIEKMKFNKAVVVGSDIRLRVKLTSLTNLRGIAKAEIQFALEIKDSNKNALEGTVLFLYHFNR